VLILSDWGRGGLILPGTIPYAPELEAALRRSTDLARDMSHAQAGTEHVLLALLDEPRAVETLRACKVDLDTLRQRLAASLDGEPVAEGVTELKTTDTLQRVLSRAALHVEVSGAAAMTGAHVVVAIMAERCRAGDLLKEQGARREDAVAYVGRTTPPPPPSPAPARVTVADKGYVDLPFPEAVQELRLHRRLGGRSLYNYYESADEEIARVESDPMLLRIYENTPDWRDKARRKRREMPYVRYWWDDAVIDGDVDLDATFDPYLIAGFAIDGNATVSGSILNWEIDTRASFLSVVGNLACEHFIVGCSDVTVLGNVRASGIMVATYNHGWLEINGDIEARTLVLDDHHALLRGDIRAPGWTTRDRGLGLPESDWRDEVRPEFVSEFFNDDGDFKDGNWNVSIVKAVIAGRDVLKSHRPRRRRR
jgi:Clp amino terminal domain, pathogenicity island component